MTDKAITGSMSTNHADDTVDITLVIDSKMTIDKGLWIIIGRAMGWQMPADDKHD